MPGLTLSKETRPNNSVVITVAGRPLPGDADALDAMIDEAVAASPRVVVVDCSKLEFIGSFGIGALIKLQKAAEAKGAKARLAGVSPLIMKILQASRIDERVAIFADVEKALV